jgi:hypothetical protein
MQNEKRLNSIPVNLSTGPTSPEGKATSSKNALKHGSCSFGTLILESESLDDFLALEKRWFQGYGINPDNPETRHEAELIRTAARADWFYQRADRNYCEIEAQMINTTPNMLIWSDDHHHTLARFQRYRTTNANILAKHTKALEDYRKNRITESTRTQRLNNLLDKQAKAKAKPERQPKGELDWEELLADMRRKAIQFGYANPDGTPTGKK